MKMMPVNVINEEEKCLVNPRHIISIEEFKRYDPDKKKTEKACRVILVDGNSYLSSDELRHLEMRIIACGGC